MENTRPQNVEHPDLTKLEDTELYLESQYLLLNIEEIQEKITNRVELLGKIWQQQPMSISSEKMCCDLKLAIGRLEAINSEVLYRNESIR